MIIEYSNAKESRNYHRLSMAIVIVSAVFFFVPTTLIILGYLASQPTGTLISPLPQGTLSQNAPSSSPIQQPTTNNQELPIIAAPSDASAASETDITPLAGSNITDKTATISANLSEVVVTDIDIHPDSQIYLSPRPQDTTTYSVKNKSAGQMTIEVHPVSDIDRYVDYHLVNP